MGTIWEQMLYLRHNKIIQPMKATAFIRKTASKNDTNSVATIYFRLRDGKKDIKAASELTINPNHWSSEKQGYKDRVALVSEEKKQALNNEVQNILNLINQNYTPESDSEWLSTLIDKYHHPNRYKTKEEIEAENKPMLLELFSEFLVKHKLSEVRKKNFRVIQRTLARYELYVRATKKGQKDFILDVDNMVSRWANDGSEKYPKCQIVLNRTYLQITHYSVRSYSPPEDSDFYFDSWNFSASIDNEENISLLDNVWESDKLSNSQVYTKEVNQEKKLFNSFTIQMTKEFGYMRITAIELFGIAFEIPKNTPHCHQRFRFHPFYIIMF